MSKVDRIKEKIERDHPTFYDGLQGISIEELKQNLLMYTKYLHETMHLLKTSEAILEAEDAKRVAEKPYKDKIKEYKSTAKELKSLVDKNVCIPDLELQLIKYAQLIEQEKFAMDIDPSVQDAKDNISITKSPVTEAKSTLELKISYIHILIHENQGFQAHEEITEG